MNDLDQKVAELETAIAGIDPANVNVSALQSKLTPRQRGAWEIETGYPFRQFNETYLASVLMWVGAQELGEPISIAAALDLTDEDAEARYMLAAVHALGEPTGVDEPSPTPAAPSSPTSPSSATSTTSPSTSSSS